MSVSLRSTESLVDTINRFYHKNLPLIYSQQHHIPILLNIIGYVIHERTFQVVLTAVPLIEPIYHIDKTVFVSKSLVAYYMNQPVSVDKGEIVFERDVDLFDGMLAPSTSASLSRAASDGGDGCLRLNRVAELTDRFSEDEYVKLTYIARLVTMVAHWQQHYSRSVPYTNHANFEPIEPAAAVAIAPSRSKIARFMNNNDDGDYYYDKDGLYYGSDDIGDGGN